MTRTEAIAMWRILSVLAGWDEIIAVEEIEDDLDAIVDRVEQKLPIADAFDDDDQAQMLDTLRALIEYNLDWHQAANTIPLRRIVDVPGADKAGIT